MRKLLWLLILMGPNMLQAQEKIRVDLQNEYRAPNDQYNPLPLYKLPENGKITYSQAKPQKEYDVKLPEGISREIAFSMEYFTGWEGAAIDKNVLMLIADYTSEQPTLYVDYNNNLDLTDDGPSVKLKRGGNAYIKLHRPDDKKAIYALNIAPGFLSLPRAPGMDSKWMDILKQNPTYGDAELVEMRFWFGSRRQNMISNSVEINRQKVQLGVMDWDCNGLYNDPVDRLLIGEYKNEYLSFSERDGAVVFSEEALYEIGDQTYEVVHIDPAGRFLEMVKTAKRKETILKPGAIVADLKFKLMNGETTSIHEFLEQGKLTLVDVWGTWCKPCVSKLPDLKAFYERYSDRVNLIAIAYDNKSSVEKFITKHKIPWPNGMVTKELLEELMVEGYPYFLLLDDRGKVLRLGTMEMTEIEDAIKSEEDED